MGPALQPDRGGWPKLRGLGGVTNGKPRPAQPYVGQRNAAVGADRAGDNSRRATSSSALPKTAMDHGGRA
eukprot:2937784-Lingulodinium_polyedra.AAC.1